MSAWYIFSSLGFYPLAPGSEEYQLGSPGIKSASLLLENGKVFGIETINQSDKNVYVAKVLLNGVLLKGHSIRHQDIVNGGKLVYYMSDKPAKK